MKAAPEEELLRSVALQNTRSILQAKKRTEEELLRVQDELRANRERLQAALSAADTGTFRCDITTGALSCDDNLARLFGRDPASMFRSLDALIESVHAEDREALAAACRSSTQQGVDLDVEFRFLSPDGALHWLAGKGKTSREDAGRPTYLTGACVEVTRRKLADEAMREGAHRLQLALDAGQLGDWTWDAETDIVTLGDRAARAFGVPDATPIRWATLSELLHDEHRELARSALQRALETHTDYDVEYRLTRPAGDECWVASRGRGMYRPDGVAVGMSGVVQDISARKHADAALCQSEEFNRTVVESSRDCIMTLTLSGNVLWLGESGRATLRLDDSSAVVGGAWAQLWTGESQTAADAAVASAARGDTGSFIGRLPVQGEPRWWDVVVTPILGTRGEPESLLAVSRDVTGHVEIERALREETRVLELLNKTGTTLTSQLDLQALLQTVTDAATELSGAKFGAFFYNTVDAHGGTYQLFTLSGAPREAFERFGHPRPTALFGPTFRGEGPIRCDDVLLDPRYGSMPPHHGTPAGHPPVRSYLAVPVVARSGEVIGGLLFGHPDVGVFTEKSERIISGVAAQAAIAIDNARLYEAAHGAAEERRQLLDSERHARSQAERLSATKDEFLAVLSHELRTPLSAILGWSHMLRRRATDDDMSKGLEIIERNARAQTQLIDDLLDMSRITSGKVRLDVQAVAPFTFIEGAIEAMRPAAAAKGIRLEVLLDPLAGPISGDASRLQQVVWNLLSNAIKFTPKDGRVQVLLRRVDSQIEVIVADSGVGIGPAFIEHVFDRFRQADSSTTRRHGGLGLGLSIAKHLVELHGGSLHVKSAGAGCGSTFTIRLPLSAVQYEADPARSHPGTPTLHALAFKPMDLSGLRILVVDDEPDARHLVARVLEDCGAQVFPAASADEALRALARERPDVLLSDIGMPDVDGFELLRRVRALGAARGGNVPAIALTAFARSEDRTRALRAGFLVHISKPIEPSELVASVATVAGRAGGGS